MSDQERAELCETLASLGVPVRAASRRERGRRLIAGAALTAAAVLCGWIVSLLVTLPQREVVEQWRLVWVGYDVAEVGGLVLTGWAALRHRQLVIPAAIVTGTLLLCDAWFDVMLSWGSNEQTASLLTAFLVEIPLALALWAVARRFGLLTLAVVRASLGLTSAGTPPRKRDLPTRPVPVPTRSLGHRVQSETG